MLVSPCSKNLSIIVDIAGLTEGEKEEGVKAKEALNEDGEGSDDEGDTRKAATYGNKKNEVCLCFKAFNYTSPVGLGSVETDCIMHFMVFFFFFHTASSVCQQFTSNFLLQQYLTHIGCYFVCIEAYI